MSIKLKRINKKIYKIINKKDKFKGGNKNE